MRPHIDPALADLVVRIASRAERRGSGSLFIGLCGAQGSGKSTLAASMCYQLRERELTTASVSLDDLYLPLAAREELARTVHPLLRTRGVPGTHEVSLGLQVFASLRAGATTLLPSFDKAADDRVAESEWSVVNAPVDVVIFEGWCVGAVPQPAESLLEPVNALEQEEDPRSIWRRYVNNALSGPYQAMFAQLDMLILLAAPSFDVVYRWRLEQENDLRRRVAARGQDASRLMSDRDLLRFVSHYERLTRHILAEMPSRADIVVRLDGERRGRIECGNSSIDSQTS